MPISPSFANFFPEDLLGASPLDVGQTTGDSSPSSDSLRSWQVLYTKTQQEKSLARQLLAWEIGFYLPLIPKDHLIRGRRVRSYLPLFSGYVFLYGTDQERIAALKTNRVVAVLPVPDQDGLWHDLRQIQRLIVSGHALTMEKRLAPGQRVRVRRGPLENLEGTVLTRRGNSRLLVAVNFLQQGASITIDDFVLEPID